MRNRGGRKLWSRESIFLSLPYARFSFFPSWFPCTYSFGSGLTGSAEKAEGGEKKKNVREREKERYSLATGTSVHLWWENLDMWEKIMFQKIKNDTKFIATIVAVILLLIRYLLYLDRRNPPEKRQPILRHSWAWTEIAGSLRVWVPRK